ncbi:MAG: M14 family zinc carboxypeptidase [bacterium]
MIERRIVQVALVMLMLAVTVSLVWAETAERHLYKISLAGHDSAAELTAAGVEILAAVPNDHALAELTADQLTKVIRMGYSVDYLAASLIAYAELDETDDYYNYTTLTAQLQSWSDTYASIATLYDLTTTVQGRHVWGMKVSDNPALEEDEIVCYYVGCHHGNEDISAEVPMYFLNHILSNYGSNPDITYWIDNREIWVLPLLNPDGYANNSRYNANTVDLNRNYSFHWGESASNYGPYPFSEVETQVVRDLNIAHHYTTSHSYHSYGELILYPFAWASNHPSPDDAFFLEIVNAMAAYNGYDPLISGNLYPHGGEQNDYLYAEKGVMAVTSEVWSGPGYNPPSSGILDVCLDNLPTDLYLLQRAEGAQITGLITDASTSAPLVAQYKVVQLWNPNEIYPRYSEPTYGRYRHLVIPGTYTLEVSKAGYATQTFSNVQVVAGTPTVQNVALTFIGFPDVTITIDPVSPPIVIPPTGGSFQYNLSIVNNSGAAQTFDVWLTITLPTGSVYGPVILRTNVTVSSGATINRLLNQNVPGTARAGTYNMNAYIGDYELTTIWSEDHFDFTKSGVDGQIVDYFPKPLDVDLSPDLTTTTAQPKSFAFQAYPNPFNPSTELNFSLPENGDLNVVIYNTLGAKVFEYNQAQLTAGNHRMTFNAMDLTSGMYIAVLNFNGTIAAQKLLLVK